MNLEDLGWQPFFSRALDDLAVEQVRLDRGRDAHLVATDLHRLQRPAGEALVPRRQIVDHRAGVDEGVLVVEERVERADRNHVVVKYARIDGPRVLFDQTSCILTV